MNPNDKRHLPRIEECPRCGKTAFLGYEDDKDSRPVYICRYCGTWYKPEAKESNPIKSTQNK